MPFVAELEWLHKTIKLAGRQASCDMKRADDIFASGVIIEQVRDQIERADVVVAVCTGQNPNVFFEMGLAWQQRFPILVTELATDLPFDVRHLRTLLYGGDDPGESRATLEKRLVQAITATASERSLPRGRRIDAAPQRKTSARISARIVGQSGGRRIQISNIGTESIHGLAFELPPEASSFKVIDNGELPIELLRTGESVSLLVVSFMGGGKHNFDLHFTGTLDDGTSFEQDIKVSAL